METGYLQHGEAPGPFLTEPVQVKRDEWPNADKWLAGYCGRWRRVHVQVNRLYIVYAGKRITIQIEGL